ncbi:MAG: hypothetical protein KAW45_02010 [Thermoplasmatales archaeon]|nr:hypothetical protein [Thermoplasmatales archaeon]
MKNKLSRMKLNKKTISLISAVCFLTLSINQCTAQPDLKEELSCYGFIASPVKCENVTVQDQINCKMRHMVNDLLREQIPVYWTTIDLTAAVKEMDESEEKTEMFFERGAFIIPFTGDLTQDIKITAIIGDYNYSSEIETISPIKIPVYALIEQIDTQVYLLSEVKLAQHKSPITIGEICFLEISRKCGFLSFELLKESVIAEKLNNNEFNVLTHAGGGNDYGTFCTEPAVFYKLYSELRYKEIKAVREFVANGGGYIGSCGGANEASSGFKKGPTGPITFYFKRRAYNPKLHSIYVYAIADYISVNQPDILGLIQVKIVNDAHPVSYRLDPITWDEHWGGEGIFHIGKNVEVIANFYNTGTWMDDTPCWISSKFGNGNVVAFSPHPEVLGWKSKKHSKDHIGRTIISNALFFTTAEEMTGLQLPHARPLTFIEKIRYETGDIQIVPDAEGIFDEIKNSISEAIGEITELNDYVQRLRNLIGEIADKKKIDLGEEENKAFLGDKSLQVTTKHYFGLFIRYLENTTEALNTLEKIYPLLENDADFVQQIETLKADISSRVAEIQKICTQGYEMCEDYEKGLLKYQQRPLILSRVKEFLLTDKGHKFYWHIYSVFCHIPQVYFNSLKFLRTSWYNYEAGVIDE